MPDLIHTLIIALVTFLVTEGIKALALNSGKDLSGNASAITAAFVALVLLLVDPLIAMIPATAEPIVSAVVSLLLAILSGFGIQRSAVRAFGHFGVMRK